MESIFLFDEKGKCCGCSACYNVCPSEAIDMVVDKYGFLYPKIKAESCNVCELCKKACAFQYKEFVNTPREVYVATSKDSTLLESSASGGIFATIAKEVLSDDGIVYGCSLEKTGGSLKAEHIRVEKEEELVKLQGSKYVQSTINNTFQKVRCDLEGGKTVLFSGTPCQVAGLYGSLGYQEYDKLLTVDLICHGVPSNQFFQSYLKEKEKKLGGEIINYIFRDKSKGWGIYGRVDYLDSKGKARKKNIAAMLSSYYHLFLTSKIYRESCYSCKYASKARCGDITIGDYWGIEKVHPEYLRRKNGVIDEQKGISCILVNTNKGQDILEEYDEALVKLPSAFAKVAKYNDQLKRPCIISDERNKILDLYCTYGYQGVESHFKKSLGNKKYIYLLKSLLPPKLRMWLKRVVVSKEEGESI